GSMTSNRPPSNWRWWEIPARPPPGSAGAGPPRGGGRIGNRLAIGRRAPGPAGEGFRGGDGPAAGGGDPSRRVPRGAAQADREGPAAGPAGTGGAAPLPHPRVGAGRP